MEDLESQSVTLVLCEKGAEHVEVVWNEPLIVGMGVTGISPGARSQSQVEMSLSTRQKALCL